jgi:hypothetical protein
MSLNICVASDLVKTCPYNLVMFNCPHLLITFFLTGDKVATKLVGSGIKPKSLAENRGVYEV